MAIDRYRKHTQGNTDTQKRVLLHRVMEQQQVDTSSIRMRADIIAVRPDDSNTAGSISPPS